MIPAIKTETSPMSNVKLKISSAVNEEPSGRLAIIMDIISSLKRINVRYVNGARIML